MPLLFDFGNNKLSFKLFHQFSQFCFSKGFILKLFQMVIPQGLVLSIKINEFFYFYTFKLVFLLCQWSNQKVKVFIKLSFRLISIGRFFISRIIVVLKEWKHFSKNSFEFLQSESVINQEIFLPCSLDRHYCTIWDFACTN